MPENIQLSGANSELLLRLVEIESKMLVLSAEAQWGLRTTYTLDDVAWDFGWEQPDKVTCLSAACTDVIASIDLLGEGIAPGKWQDAVGHGDYDRTGYEQDLRDIDRKIEREMKEQTDRLSENNIVLNDVPFRKIYGDPYGSDGYVYIQEKMSMDANFCVRKVGNHEDIIAVLSSAGDAIATARYAASHDGGSGDVCIITSDLPVTDRSFEDWFL